MDNQEVTSELKKLSVETIQQLICEGTIFRNNLVNEIILAKIGCCKTSPIPFVVELRARKQPDSEILSKWKKVSAFMNKAIIAKDIQGVSEEWIVDALKSNVSSSTIFPGEAAVVYAAPSYLEQ